MDNIYSICEDCRYAIWYCEDPGYSPKECGLSSSKITWLEGCKKNMEPYYNEEQESIECEERREYEREY